MMDELDKGQELSELLQTKVVEFSFKKNNGEIRFVFGTSNPECIPKDKQAKDQITTHQTIRFFDLNKNEWRSCRRDSVENIHGYMSASLWQEKEIWS